MQAVRWPAQATKPALGLPGCDGIPLRVGARSRGLPSFRFADHTETYAAGDAYYAPAGHTPVMTAGTEVVEFSPTEALNATMAVVEANLAAAAGTSA